MSDDQFKKLFKYMEERFAALEKAQAELKAEINRVYDLVDEDLKRREIDEQERLAMNRQLDRHEDWIGRASKQVGVSYRQ